MFYIKFTQKKYFCLLRHASLKVKITLKKNSLAIKISYKFIFGTVDYFKLICGTVRLFTYHMDPLLRSMEQL